MFVSALRLESSTFHCSRRNSMRRRIQLLYSCLISQRADNLRFLMNGLRRLTLSTQKGFRLCGRDAQTRSRGPMHGRVNSYRAKLCMLLSDIKMGFLHNSASAANSRRREGLCFPVVSPSGRCPSLITSRAEQRDIFLLS